MSAEDLGPDFRFERDPMALASILNEEGITPAAAAKAPDSRPFRTGLTPASKRHLNSAMIRKQTEYDFFEGKNGNVFYRPKPAAPVGSGPLSGSKAGRGFGRSLATNFQPRRIGARPALNSPMSTTRRRINTEKKMNPMVVFPAPHRQSISERKAIPGFEGLGNSFGLGRQGAAKKSLFAEKSDATSKNDSFEFAKPLSPFERQPRQELQSRAELILMREGLMGMPRESMSALLRQSLSKAELDKMFEDDSTENFEALERRLKTPKRPKVKPALSRIPVPSVTKAEEVKENLDPVETQATEEPPVQEETPVEHETKVQPSAFLGSLGKTAASIPLDKEGRKSETPARVLTGNNLHKELLDESNVVNVEIEEEEGDFDSNEGMPGGLAKSFSTNDLPSVTPTAAHDVKSEEDEAEIQADQPLMKPSMSSIDLSDARAVRNVELASFYRKVLEEHEQHQEEMKLIEIEMKELMEKAKARRLEFRAQWGVSPKSVNNLRTMKTMYIGVQSVVFSSEKAKPAKAESAEESAPTTEVALADETFDLEAEFNAVEDLIFNSAKKDIDPDLTHAMTEAEILDYTGGGCRADLADAFDDILLDDEDMDITLAIGFDGSEVVQSGKKSVVKKGVRFETEAEDDDEIHVTLPKTPYSGAKCQVGLHYEDEGLNGKEGVSSVKGKLDFD